MSTDGLQARRLTRTVFSVTLRARAIMIWAKMRYLAARPALPSVFMVLAGAAGAIYGGHLIGRWCEGLVILALGAGLIALGLNRESGERQPPMGPVAEVLERYRQVP